PSPDLIWSAIFTIGAMQMRGTNQVGKAAMTRQRSQFNGKRFVIASEKRLGRIKRAVRREFLLSNGQPIVARQILERAFPRVRSFLDWHRWSVRRALLQEAVCVGRHLRFRGRPCIWQSKSAW